MNKIFSALVLCAGIVASGSVAASISYPTPGTYNDVDYNFTATTTGAISAYFYFSEAAATSTISLLVNGVQLGATGLPNHGSSFGDSILFGNVTAGDNLVFKLNYAWEGVGAWFSDASMNVDSLNHIYSTSFAGEGIIPAGTLVGFEDLHNVLQGDYNDHVFVFSNVSTSVPEPSIFALLGLGLLGFSFSRRAK
ncbi:PEP-CTERM sorting domain-containing protein [Chromatium okenii]|jgi:hypothetical protein|uniref:Pyruvate-binding protein n=1 Tax=Chromatium okenii TaxID=61644 RepID=A0A2S7XP87_9GAMM|nr:PEP-CTERM sorting domain-containing protein [Chromatium okenii]MBV5309157.1 PEP-CTERM sorting domain-containing protein [Chromatium okenii]PQJ95557.1 pyruvate-binding protein [Chromatium okenii]